MIVTYDPINGKTHPEHMVESAMTVLAIKGEDFTIGSTLEMTFLRVLVKRGVIVPFQYKYTDAKTTHFINVDKDGNIDLSPDGFCDKIETWLMELF